MAPYDTIIIGAGMSGLAAGIRLAHFGRRVCILERHSTVGGLNSFYRHNRRSFDVGLHAVTNYAPKGTRRGPLARLLRQLRMPWDELALVPQVGSAIAFPGVTLRFSNDFELLESEVARHFPSQRGNLRRLVAEVADYDDLEFATASRISAREVLHRAIGEPLLVEMLLCPLMFYGAAGQGDMDFGQFCVMFRSIYLEGLARPLAGARWILKKLAGRFKSLGGELRLRTPVHRIACDGDQVEKLVLADGEELAAKGVLSSAGWCETMEMCNGAAPADRRDAGQVSFLESIFVLDRQPRELGCDKTIVFYNDSERFDYGRPDDLADARSGVICSPNNFEYSEPPPEGMIRISSLANFDRWAALDAEPYREAKRAWHEKVAASAVRFVPDFRGAVIDTHGFTPRTIHRFTGHVNGAVYGSPNKHYDGTTHLSNLFICGNDQGFVGIVGAIISGITMANRHLLRE